MITITKVGSLVKIDGIEGKDNVYESISNFQGARLSADGTQLSIQIGEVNIDYKPLANFTIGGTVPTNAATVQTALATVFPSAAPATALPTEYPATYAAMQASITADPTTKRDFFVSADETNGNKGTWYKYDGTTVQKLSDRPLFEGKQNLKDFFKNLYAYQITPASTYIGIGYYGDSTANHIANQFINALFNYYQRASLGYPSYLTSSLLLTSTGTIVNHGNRSILSQTSYDGSDGGVDFTYVPSGDHIVMSNGSTITLDTQQSIGYSTVKTIFAIGSGMGSAFVELLDEANATVQSSALNLSNPTIGANKVQFSGLSKTIKYKIRVTATNTVVFLRCEFLRTNGIMVGSFSRGGSTLTQNNFANKTIFSYLLSEYNISLMFLQAKEESVNTAVPATMSIFNTYLTSVSRLVIGSLPDSRTNGALDVENEVFRTNALANNCAYFDGVKTFGSNSTNGYNELVRLGWNGDGTHPTDPANQFVASLILGELSVMEWTGTTEKRAINHSGTSNNVFTNKLQIPKGDGSWDTIDVIETYGGAQPTDVVVHHVRNIVFSGGKSDVAPRLGGFGTTEVGAFDKTDAFIPFRAKKYTATDAASNNDFAGPIIASSGIRHSSSTGPKDLSGTGTPEGSVNAPVGSTYRRTDGGAGTSFYVKESGTGNTGWVAK